MSDRADWLRAVITLRREPDDRASAAWFMAGCAVILVVGLYALVTR